MFQHHRQEKIADENRDGRIDHGLRRRAPDAFRAHGRLRNSLTEDVPASKKVMDDLALAGISMKEVTDKLTQDGVKLFADAFDKLLAAVAKSTQAKG